MLAPTPGAAGSGGSGICSCASRRAELLLVALLGDELMLADKTGLPHLPGDAFFSSRLESVWRVYWWSTTKHSSR